VVILYKFFSGGVSGVRWFLYAGENSQGTKKWIFLL
jgi:hypothetical protein